MWCVTLLVAVKEITQNKMMNNQYETITSGRPTVQYI